MRFSNFFCKWRKGVNGEGNCGKWVGREKHLRKRQHGQAGITARRKPGMLVRACVR